MALTRLLPLRFLNHPRSGRWPWLSWAAAWVLTAMGLAFYSLTYSVSLGPRWGPRAILAIGAIVIAPMGAVVASRRPQNVIGWIYCGIGLLCSIQFLAQEYAVMAVLVRPGLLPAGEWAAWLQNWIWVPAAALYLIFIPLFLPNGRLPSPRWRPAAWFAGFATALLAFSWAIQPGPLQNFYRVVNPMAAPVAPGLWLVLGQASFLLLDGVILAAAGSLVWRARHSNVLERQQLKWLAFAFMLGALALVAGGLVPVLAAPLLIATLAAMHAATGISILRYRLYDLDVFVNRTVVYGLLTLALAAVYFGSVVVLQRLAVAVTGQQRSELVTVLSTLAIAALFNPLRQRIQKVIDQRFFRRKYDAGKALARFSLAIREDYSGDLDRLNESLIRAVDETLEPEFVSLWVRPTSSKESR